MVDLFTGGNCPCCSNFCHRVLWFVPLDCGIAAVAAGVSLKIFELIGMRLRRVNPNVIVNGLISAHKAD